MEKFRRIRKTSPSSNDQPSSLAQPATSSNVAAASSTSSTSAATTFIIQQKIPTGSAPKKGPYSVERAVVPNEVFIKRRIGEGTRPIFSRDEIRAKRSASPKSKITSSSSSTPSHSSSPEGRSHSTKEKANSQSIKRRTPEKVPYFFNELAQPATSSNVAAASSTSSTSAATTFIIQQKIPTGSAPKKGPYSVERAVVPNEVFIKRRIGEGTRPIFSRDEIRAKRSASPKSKITSSSSSTPSHSSSPEGRSHSTKEKANSQSIKRRTPEMVPYFLDEKRENDRIKRVCGSRRSRSSSRSTLNRSQSRSPPHYGRRYQGRYGTRRTPSRERYESRYRRTAYSRSRSRERRRNSYRRLNELHDVRSLPPATQFIPVPVPLEYPFMPPAWGPPIMPPPPRFPFMMRPPIPMQLPFMPRYYRPPFFMRNGLQRGNFRPRY